MIGTVTLDDVLRVRGAELKRQGDEHHGPCPLCGGKDRWWCAERDGALIIQCRQCDASFPEHLRALGFELGDGGETIIPPLMPAAPAPAPPPPPTVEPGTAWTCEGPEGSARHVYNGRDADTGKKRFAWETIPDHPFPENDHRRVRASGLVYKAGNKSSTQAVIVEGQKAADALAHYLPELRVVAVVGTMPENDTLAWALAGCAEVTIWPDNDVPGMAYRDKLLKAVPEVVPDVLLKVVNIGALHPGAIGDGWDAADWRPRDPRRELDRATSPAAAEAPAEQPYRRWRLLSEVEAGETDEPPVVARGLLWRDRLTHLWAAEKIGKSSLLWAALAAVTTGRPWLGESTTAGAVAVMTEEPIDAVATRMKRYGGDPARVYVFEPCKLADFEAALAELPSRPAVVAVDTLRALLTAERVKETDTGGHINNVANGLAHAAHGSGQAWVFTHHAQRSGEAYAHSGTIGAAPDMNIGMTAGADRERVLAYRGRWHQDGLRVVLGEKSTGYAEATPGGGTSGDDGGPLVPGTPESRAATFAQKWLMQNPSGKVRQFKLAARAAGIKGRSSALEAALRDAPRARDARVGLGDTGDTGKRVSPKSVPTPVPIDGDAGDRVSPEAVPRVPHPIGGTPIGGHIAERPPSVPPGTVQEHKMTTTDPPTDTGLQGFAALRGGRPICTLCRIAARRPGDYICHHCRREKAAGKSIDPEHLTTLQALDRLNVFEETYVETTH